MPLAEKLLEVRQQLVRTALELELQDGAVVGDNADETPCVFELVCIGQNAALRIDWYG